jgi:hypothetical protein
MTQSQGLSPDQKRQYANTLLQQQHQQQSFRQDAVAASSYDPWGKGTGQPQRDVHGNIIQTMRTRDDSSVSYGLSLVENMAKNPLSRSQTTVQASVDSGVYDPFGRAGAGAPIYNVDGSLRTRVVGAAELQVTGVLQQREREDAQAKASLLQYLKSDIAQREASVSAVKCLAC